MTDGGSENLGLDRLTHTNHGVAQVDVVQSNSLVEALWSLKRLVAKYFADHDTIIREPSSAAEPQTKPSPEQTRTCGRLQARHAQARVQRIAVNQTRRCSACRPGPELVM